MHNLIKILDYKKANMCFKYIENDSYFNKIKNYNGWNSTSIENFLKEKSSLSFGYYKGKKLIGFIISRYFFLNNVSEIDLLLIFVNKKYRRSGIGKYLIKYLIMQANNSSRLNIFLEFVDTNIAAKNFYNKCGFKKMFKRKNYYVLSNGVRKDAEIYKLSIKNNK